MKEQVDLKIKRFESNENVCTYYIQYSKLMIKEILQNNKFYLNHLNFSNTYLKVKYFYSWQRKIIVHLTRDKSEK